MAETVIKLTKAIKVHGPGGSEEITELKLREPVGGDAFGALGSPGLGSPVKRIYGIGGGTIETYPDYAVLGKWIERLSGKNAGELWSLGMKDTNKIYAWLIPFFNDMPAEDETETLEKK